MGNNELLTKLSLDDLGILDQCGRIEAKCAELYRHFEKLYAGNEELSALWRKTANEEDNHALQFRLAANIKGTGMEGVRASQPDFTKKLKHIESFIEKVIQSQPTSVEALRIAIHLEENMQEFHMSSMVDFADPDMSNLFVAMMNNDKGHVDMLGTTLKKMAGTGNRE